MPEPAADQSGPLVDVILPVRNYARFLDQSIRSILEQSMPRLRLIAVDYGSTDETPAILDRFAAADRRVEVVALSGGTLVAALNSGLSRARAPFIARQDADDVSLPDRLARQIEAFEASPDTVAVSGSCVHIDAEGRDLGSRYQIGDPSLADFASIPSREPYLLQPFFMARREAMLAVGGYRAGFVSFAEDTDLYWRLARRGPLVNIPTLLGRMRLHGQSITNASIENGRLLAVFSQLAAISARRIDRGLDDIDLDGLSVQLMRQAGTLAGMIAGAGDILSQQEREHLTAAAAAKLLELSASRSFALESSDCAFISNVYRALPSASLRGRSVANWAYRAALLRLLQSRRLNEACALGHPAVLARIAATRIL